MGIIRNGANGGFSGKAGSVVGSNWKDINYIKGLPKKSNKAPSQAQLEQQARFALVIKTLQPVTKLLNEGFKNGKTARATGYNLALQHLINNAITGTYPNFAIDYSKMVISKGNLIAPSNPQLAIDAGTLGISWSPILSKYGAFLTDELTALIYNPAKNIYLPAEGATRGEGSLEFELPTEFAGDTLHVYLFFTSIEGNRHSNSTYAGQIVV